MGAGHLAHEHESGEVLAGAYVLGVELAAGNVFDKFRLRRRRIAAEE